MLYTMFGILLTLSLIMALFFKSRYIKCPPDKILVIYGRVEEEERIKQSGSTFIWPIIQDYEFLDLNGYVYELEEGFSSKDKQPFTVKGIIKYEIGREKAYTDNSIYRLLGKSRNDIKELMMEIISVRVEQTILVQTKEEVDGDKKRVILNIEKEIRDLLKEFGLKITLLRVEITALN